MMANKISNSSSTFNHLKSLARTVICMYCILILMQSIPGAESCSCQFPKSFRNSFCQSKFAAIVTFDSNNNDNRLDETPSSTSPALNRTRTAVKPESRRLTRLLKRQLERESSLPVLPVVSSTLEYKSYRLKEVREIIHVTPEGKVGLSSRKLWARNTKSSCNPLNTIKFNATPFLVFGDSSPDGKLLLESCKAMQWDSLTDDERSLIRSYVRNGLPCR